MKKTKLKNYLKLGILLFGISFVLINCERDEVNTNFEEVNKKRFKKVSFSEFNSRMTNDKSFENFSKLLDVNNKGLFQKNDNNETPIILTDEIVMIQTNDITHYTFKLSVEQEDNEFYNLNIFVDNQGEIIDFKVFKYVPDAIWLEDTSQSFSGYISIANNVFELSDIQDTLYSKTKTVEACIDDVSAEWECSFGNPHAPGTCNATSFDYIVTVNWVPCSSGGGGGGGGTSPPIHIGSETDGTDDCNTCGANGGTSGTGSQGAGTSSNTAVLPPTQEFIEPCDKLNHLIDSTKVNIKPSLELLKTTLNQDGENGVSMKKATDPTTGDVTYTNVNLPATTGNSIGIPAGGGENYAGVHTHSQSTYPMFSWNDINTLFNLHLRATSDTKSEVAFMLVSQETLVSAQQDVYALHIDDWREFRNAFNAELNAVVAADEDLTVTSSLEDKIKKINEVLGDDYRDSTNIERTFLDFFKDYNISLYKANEDITNWSKLTIPESPVQLAPDETPCN